MNTVVAGALYANAPVTADVDRLPLGRLVGWLVWFIWHSFPPLHPKAQPAGQTSIRPTSCRATACCLQVPGGVADFPAVLQLAGAGLGNSAR